jgi:predicted transposase YbfD/YdcC
MHYNTLALKVKIPQVPYMVTLEELYAEFATLEDTRHLKGLRYKLPLLLLLSLLAKLAGQHEIEEIAAWVKAYEPELIMLLNLSYPKMPSAATFRRVFDNKMNVTNLELILCKYFASQLGAEIPARGSLTMSIDGKTLRSTIPAGQTQGLHLMAAYLPQKGVVLAQVAVDGKSNEITAAPKLVKMVDLRGVVVTGDAMQAQRDLSTQIREDQGDYLWFVKGNQPTLLGEIKQLFEEEPVSLGPGFSPPPTDFESATKVEKGHGRIERRTITVRSMLGGCGIWPYLQQVFRLEREWIIVATGEIKQEVRYGITSLPREVAGPERVMEIAREEWGIENRVHWVRDVVFGEDRCQAKRGQTPQVLAALSNAVISIMGLGKVSEVAKGQRDFNYKIGRALLGLDLDQVETRLAG